LRDCLLPKEGASETARPNLSHLSILVIDDSAPMRKVITLILRKLDC
jgi:PleD family two-component response regulator